MTNNLELPIEHTAEGLLKAREFRGMSLKDAANLVRITPTVLKSYENGKYYPSLPVLEALAYIYQIPLDILLSPERLEKFTYQPNAEQVQQLISVRQKIISTTLQIALDNSGISPKILAVKSGISRSKIKKYLDGGEISLDDLKKVSSALSVDQSQLLDKESQIGLWQEKQKAFEQFSQLPEGIIEFISSSGNQEFLVTAKSLSSLELTELEKLSDALNRLRDLMRKNP